MSARDHTSDSVAALHTWLAGLLGRQLTPDESQVLMALFHKSVHDVLMAMRRQLLENPGAFL